MSQMPAAVQTNPAHLPPPLPQISTIPAAPIQPYPRGPVGGPYYPYQPATFGLLFLWWAILSGLGLIPIIGLPMLAAGVVLSAVLRFKCWNQIQDGHQRTSPGKAVGFMFIPFFNFYWVFVAVHGLVVDLNAYLRRYGLPGAAVSEGLALASCILWVLMWPGLLLLPLHYIVRIAWFVVTCMLFNQIKNASMTIAQAKLVAGAQAGTIRAA